MERNPTDRLSLRTHRSSSQLRVESTAVFVVATSLAFGFGGGFGAIVMAILLFRMVGINHLRHHIHWPVVAACALAAAVPGNAFFGTRLHLVSVGLCSTGLIVQLLISRFPSHGRRLAIWACVGSALAAVVAVIVRSGGYLDVALMHYAAAEALAQGTSPWSDLAVPSGDPASGGSVLTGSPYPPLPMLMYSVAQWTLGDPLLAGAAAWITLAATCGVATQLPPEVRVALVTALPLPLLFWAGWTEMVTIAMFSLAATVGWRRMLGPVVLGLALATKQYLIIAIAPVMRWRVSIPRRVVAIAVAGVVTAVGFLFGSGYLQSIVGVYSDLTPRADGASLYGVLVGVFGPLGWPVWVGPIAGAGWSIFRSYVSPPTRISHLLRIIAEGLTILFLLGTQSFANYWTLVLALLLLTVEHPIEESVASQPTNTSLRNLPV